MYKAIELAVNDGDTGFQAQNLNLLFDLNVKIDDKALLTYINKILTSLDKFQLSMQDKKTLGDYCQEFVEMNYKNQQGQRTQFK